MWGKGGGDKGVKSNGKWRVLYWTRNDTFIERKIQVGQWTNVKSVSNFEIAGSLNNSTKVRNGNILFREADGSLVREIRPKIQYLTPDLVPNCRYMKEHYKNIVRLVTDAVIFKVQRDMLPKDKFDNWKLRADKFVK